MIQLSFETWLIIFSALGGLCSLGSSLMSLSLVAKHLKYYTYPTEQRLIVRILLMIPIYSTCSWISLTWPFLAAYVNVMRDCYEAYVIYLFVALLIAYLGGSGEDSEQRVIDLLASKPAMRHPWPLCCLPTLKMGRKFLIWQKRGVLQFTILKPITALITIITQLTDTYGDSLFDFTKALAYLNIVDNLSVSWSLYCLFLFYLAARIDLAPHKPATKFLAVKTVIFLTFWQGVMVSFFVQMDWVHGYGEWTKEEVAEAAENFAICVEMFLVALVHPYVFDYRSYRTEERIRLFGHKDLRDMEALVKNFVDVADVSDVVKDTRSTFRPSEKTKQRMRNLPNRLLRHPRAHDDITDAEGDNEFEDGADLSGVSLIEDDNNLATAEDLGAVSGADSRRSLAADNKPPEPKKQVDDAALATYSLSYI